MEHWDDINPSMIKAVADNIATLMDLVKTAECDGVYKQQVTTALAVCRGSLVMTWMDRKADQYKVS